MNKFAENPIFPVEQRITNPSYGEQDFMAEVEANKQGNIHHLKELLDTEQDPKWQKIWRSSIKTYDDPENTKWLFIHEFTRLMPTSTDRQAGVISKKLVKDLDQVIRKHYDYDRYVKLKNRSRELVMLEKKKQLSRDEKDELEKICDELSKYDLGLLYIEMRRFGYTQEELYTAKK